MKIHIYKDNIYFGTVDTFEKLLKVNNNLKEFGKITFEIGK